MKNNENLNSIVEIEDFDWQKEVGYKIKNKKWLAYSSNIARRVLAAIEDKKGMSQKSLAKQIGVTPQNISKILKGNANLTLKTIASLSAALDVEFITFPHYKDDYKITTVNYLPGVDNRLIISDLKTDFFPESNSEFRIKFTKSTQENANYASA